MPRRPLKKRPFQRRRFAAKVRRKAMTEFKRGTITENQKDVVFSKTYNTKELDKLCDMTENQEYGAFDFSSIWEWIQANWPTILQLLLTVLVLDPDADNDNDGLTNAEDLAEGTDPFSNDTDGDVRVDRAQGKATESAAEDDGDGSRQRRRRLYPATGAAFPWRLQHLAGALSGTRD